MKNLLYLIGLLFITSTCSTDNVIIEEPKKEIIYETVYDTVAIYDTIVVPQHKPIYYKSIQKAIVYDTVTVEVYEYIPEIIYEYTHKIISDTIWTEIDYCGKQGFICRLLCGKK